VACLSPSWMYPCSALSCSKDLIGLGQVGAGQVICGMAAAEVEGQVELVVLIEVELTAYQRGLSTASILTSMTQCFTL